jgi:hypothetical protein
MRTDARKHKKPHLARLLLDATLVAAALTLVVSPGIARTAAKEPVTSFGGTVAALVPHARALVAQRPAEGGYALRRIPCAAGAGALTCWTTAATR